MSDCIFCQIAAGKAPAYKVYEDEQFYGILDIFPRVKGHCLLIPKDHHRWVYDVPDFGAYWEAARTVATACQKAFNPEFVSFITHGLEVPHAHIHIMPRQHGESVFVPPTMNVTKEELEDSRDKILKAMKAQ